MPPPMPVVLLCVGAIEAGVRLPAGVPSVGRGCASEPSQQWLIGTIPALLVLLLAALSSLACCLCACREPTAKTAPSTEEDGLLPDDMMRSDEAPPVDGDANDHADGRPRRLSKEDSSPSNTADEHDPSQAAMGAMAAAAAAAAKQRRVSREDSAAVSMFDMVSGAIARVPTFSIAAGSQAADPASPTKQSTDSRSPFGGASKGSPPDAAFATPSVVTPTRRRAKSSVLSGGLRLPSFALPLNKISKDLDTELGVDGDEGGSYLTGRRSTPFRPGLVKCVTDRWVDTHQMPIKVLATQPPPDPISNERESARVLDPSFSSRQAEVADGLSHLPSQWAG